MCPLQKVDSGSLFTLHMMIGSDSMSEVPLCKVPEVYVQASSAEKKGK